MSKTLLKSMFVVVSLLSMPTPALAWLSASRTWLSFPRTEIGRGGVTDYVTIYNFGTEPARGVSVMNSCFGAFNVSHFCFGDLSPGMSCSINVRFQPMSKGYHNCTINVSSIGQGMVSISASGEGY